MSSKYLLTLGDADAIGPHKSCTSSRHRLTWYSTFIKNDVHHCFLI
jgi:hypothetical protein